jgi:aromatic-L-amino-acid decarboxylase
VAMNICCFRFVAAGCEPTQLNALNDEIVVQLQLRGIAAPSTTLLKGQTAIRVNITNHRTQFSDLDLLLAAVIEIGTALAPQFT